MEERKIWDHESQFQSNLPKQAVPVSDPHLPVNEI